MNKDELIKFINDMPLEYFIVDLSPVVCLKCGFAHMQLTNISLLNNERLEDSWYCNACGSSFVLNRVHNRVQSEEQEKLYREGLKLIRAKYKKLFSKGKGLIEVAHKKDVAVNKLYLKCSSAGWL